MSEQKLFTKDFTLVLIGQIISLFGNAILRFALPLYLLRQTGSSTLYGIVTACSFLPMILLSLAGGVIADRANKRNIMVALDFTTAGIILVYYVLYGLLPLVPLLIVVLMLLYGIAGAYQPAVQASIPVLLSRDNILKGNSAINAVNTLANLIGPILGGVLFGLWGLAPVLILSIVCFTASAIMEIFIHIPFIRPDRKAKFWLVLKNDLKDSVFYLRKEKPVFIRVVILLALFNLVLSSVMVVGIPVMVVNILQMNDLFLGIAQASLGLGGILGGVLGGILSDKLKLRSTYLYLLLCAAAAAIMGLALFPFMLPLVGYIIICAMSIVAMAAATLFIVQLCAAIQRQTPQVLIGKIMAFVMTVSNCASPLGQALYGVLFDVSAAMPYLILFGAGVLAFMISLLSKKTFANLEAQENTVQQEQTEEL